MGTKEILAKMKEIQQNLLEYIEKKDDVEEIFQNFKAIFKDQNTIDDYLMIVLRLISQISNEHYREENFDQKIEEILKFFKNDIKKKYSNSAIFDIFKFNKKLLLFLIEEGILTPDRYICKQMMRKQFKKMRYPEYFFPEIKQFIPAFIKPKKNPSYRNKDDNSFYEKFSEQLPENFEEKRKIGENDDYICHLIRNDLIDEFITYINKNDISLETAIKPSIYETHPLLLQKQVVFTDFNREESEKYNLIKYATFFGSTQIFKYLYKNEARLTPSLWIYAIHSDNPEIIQLLEEMEVEIDIDQIFIESIKCHHNNITNYIVSKYRYEKEGYILIQYFNFIQMDENILNEIELSVLCEYDYSPIIKELIKTTEIDFNECIEKESNSEFDDEEDLYYEKGEESLLFYAIQNGSVETVRLLASCDDVDVNSPCSLTRFYAEDYSGLDGWDGWNETECEIKVTPLLASIKRGIVEIVEILLSNGAYVDDKIKYARSDNGDVEDYCTFSTLYYTVKYENPEIVKLFLSKKKKEKIDKNIFAYHNFDGNGQHFQDECKSSLHLAIENNNVEIAKLLIESELLDVNDIKTRSYYVDEHEEWSIGYEEETTNPLCIAVKNNNVEIVKLLLNDSSLKINQMNTSVHNNIYYSDGGAWCDSIAHSASEAYFDCSSKSDVSSFNGKSEKKSALHIAIENNNVEMVKLLLGNNEIDVNAFCESDNRCFNSDEHTVKKNTPLHNAIEKGNVEIVKLLLENEKIDVNLPSLLTISPCQFEYDDDDDDEEEEDQVKNVNEKTTPLHFAIIKGNQVIIDLLMGHKNIDVDLNDELSQK